MTSMSAKMIAGSSLRIVVKPRSNLPQQPRLGNGPQIHKDFELTLDKLELSAYLVLRHDGFQIVPMPQESAGSGFSRERRGGRGSAAMSASAPSAPWLSF